MRREQQPRLGAELPGPEGQRRDVGLGDLPWPTRRREGQDDGRVGAAELAIERDRSVPPGGDRLQGHAGAERAGEADGADFRVSDERPARRGAEGDSEDTVGCSRLG